MTDLALEREAIALFERLLDVPEAERDAWLAGEVGDRAELLSRVQAMRDAHRVARLRTGALADAIDEEPPPDRIGAYRIAERIGRGGMGSVYRGERDSGDFAHVVAIKVIKPGLLSEALIDRFQRERQLLAGLSHPNIAQLHDGGETASGAPYFVMEYVDGLPLLDWIEERQPPRGERQRLFCDICDAVAFAHRNLIVHRDLTPSNVLVTHDGRVKLIDFGIARPADADGAPADASRSSLTNLSLTPGYAAPERMTSVAVTTAADIYSLGKLLEKLIPPAAGDRELRAIVARATAPDSQDRYPTADALGADVAAWRDGLPVAAVNGGRRYATAKFIARHRLAVAAAAAALLLLVGAFALTVRAYTQAETARAAEAERFGEVRSLATYLLFDLDDRLRRIPGSVAAREANAARAQDYLDRLAASPIASRAVRLETVAGFLRLADIQGHPLERSLGVHDEAKANLEKARGLVARIREEHGDGPDLAILSARADATAGSIAFQQEGKVEEARTLLQRGQAAIDGVPAAARTEAWHRASVAVSRSTLDLLLINEEFAALPAAVARHRAAVAAWPPAMAGGDGAIVEHAIADYHEGSALTYTPREAEAYRLLRRANEGFAAAESRRRNDPDLLYWIAWTGGEAYGSATRIGLGREATPTLLAARDASARLGGMTDDDRTARTTARAVDEFYAMHLALTGRHEEAVATIRAVIASRVQANGADPGAVWSAMLAYSELVLGDVARLGGDRALACESWRLAARHFGQAERDDALVGYNRGFLPNLRRNLAACAAGRPVTEFGPMR